MIKAFLAEGQNQTLAQSTVTVLIWQSDLKIKIINKQTNKKKLRLKLLCERYVVVIARCRFRFRCRCHRCRRVQAFKLYAKINGRSVSSRSRTVVLRCSSCHCQ